MEGSNTQCGFGYTDLESKTREKARPILTYIYELQSITAEMIQDNGERVGSFVKFKLQGEYCPCKALSLVFAYYKSKCT